MNRKSKNATLVLAFAAVTSVAVVLGMFFYRSHQQSLSLNSGYIGFYRGLGRHDGPGVFGKTWVYVRVDEGDDGWWEVDLDGYGWAPYRGFYPDGSLREEGFCMVAENGLYQDPAPDRHQILNGKYYDPSGNIAGEIKNGTGRQVLFHADGTKSWELELRNGIRVHHVMYGPLGRIVNTHGYDTKGHWDGPYVINYEDGTPKRRGRYDGGKMVGVWYSFHPDGSVEAIEDYNSDPPIETAYPSNKRFLDTSEVSVLDNEADIIPEE